MNTFYKTLLICGGIALFIVLIFFVTQGSNGLDSIGISLVLGSPIVLILGFLVVITTKSGSELRQVGQAIVLASLLYLLVGYASCSAGNVRL